MPVVAMLQVAGLTPEITPVRSPDIVADVGMTLHSKVAEAEQVLLTFSW
jgi:hypothetical protein